MVFRIITSKEGLRPDNIILVDEFVFPANFICAQLRRLPSDPELEELFADPFPKNMAYANLSLSRFENIFDYREKLNYPRPAGKFIGECLINGDKENDVWMWRISYGENFAEISFLHELQNFFEDWTGLKLLP